MNRQVIGSAITRTLVILIIAVAAAASGLYLLGKNELIEIGVILAAIVSLLIAPISSYRVLSLIQQLEETRQRLEDISTHDYLTGIYNRRFIVEQASTILALGLRHGFPVSLIMLDIDRFKQVNDTHGHATGIDPGNRHFWSVWWRKVHRVHATYTARRCGQACQPYP